MSDFTNLAKMYLANEEKLVTLLMEAKPFLEEREKLEKLEPAFKGLRAAEVSIRLPANQLAAKEEKARKEKEDRKRKAGQEMDKLGSARKKRGDQDPPRETTTSLDPDSSGQIIG